MAKKTAAPTEQPQASMSKMEAIQRVLAKGIESPTEIVKQVKQEFGMDVHPVYVSNVKAHTKSRHASKTKTAKGDGLEAAIQFCEGVGGVDAAKTLLETIERIRKL